MPMFHEVQYALNQALAPDQIGALDSASWAPSVPFRDVLQSRGIAAPDSFFAFTDSWPRSVRHAFRAALHSGIERGVGVTVAWMPGYDYELTVTESPGVDVNGQTTRGAITVVVRTRYPNDTHPAGGQYTS